MGKHHHHHHHEVGHGHSHHEYTNEKSLFLAILINFLLTVVQIVGGIFSGSFSLIADALHNLSDAGSLVVAYFAQKISGKPATKEMTFGYGRAQIIGALINSISLVFIGIYLLVESGKKIFYPSPIDGWIVVIIASVALIIDLLTALLTYKGSKESINMKAAFVHNLTDALASVVVIITGILILLFKIYWVDFIATLFISVYVLWHSWGLTVSCIKILMQAVPEDIDRAEVVKVLEKIKGVINVHHVHIWALADTSRMLEGHVKVDVENFIELEKIKKECKETLKQKFNINHSTLEFEDPNENCSYTISRN